MKEKYFTLKKTGIPALFINEVQVEKNATSGTQRKLTHWLVLHICENRNIDYCQTQSTFTPLSCTYLIKNYTTPL